MHLSNNGSNNDSEVYHILIRLLEIESMLGCKFLKSEARLLALIKSDPGNSVKYYLNKSGLSSRWFYKIVADLVDSGYVDERPSSDDARRKLLF